MKRPIQLKRLTNFQKLMLTYSDSEKMLVNQCLKVSKTFTCTVPDVKPKGCKSGTQNCKDVESEFKVCLSVLEGKMNVFPKDHDVSVPEQKEHDWFLAQDSERSVIDCDEHNTSVFDKVCVIPNVSKNNVEGLETVTDLGKAFDQYLEGTFSLVSITKNKAYIFKFTSKNIMTIKEKLATDQTMDISKISDLEESLKKSGVMLGLPKCQSESGQNGIEESLKFLSPIVTVSCCSATSGTGLNDSADAESPGTSSLTSSDASLSSCSSVTMTTGSCSSIKRKRTKHDHFIFNMSREKGKNLSNDKNLSKLEDDDNSRDMSDKEGSSEDSEGTYYELRRKPKVDYIGTKITEHYIESVSKGHKKDSDEMTDTSASPENSVKNFPVSLLSTYEGRKSLNMKRKLESKREHVRSEDFISSPADIATVERSTAFSDLDSRKETVNLADNAGTSPNIRYNNKEPPCIQNDADIKDTSSSKRKRRKFGNSASSSIKKDILGNKKLKTGYKGAKIGGIDLTIFDRESTTENSEKSTYMYNLRRKPKVDYCGTKINRYYIDSMNKSNKNDGEQSTLQNGNFNRDAAVAISEYKQRNPERLNSSEEIGERFKRFDILVSCMKEKEILDAKRTKKIISNLEEGNNTDGHYQASHEFDDEKDSDENFIDIESCVKRSGDQNVKSKYVDNNGPLLEENQGNPNLNQKERYSPDCHDKILQEKDSSEKFTDNESLDSLLLENPFSLEFSSPDSSSRFNGNDVPLEQGKHLSGNTSTQTLPNGRLLKKIVPVVQLENKIDYAEKIDDFVSEGTAGVSLPGSKKILAETAERNHLYENSVEGKLVGIMKSDKHYPVGLFPDERSQEVSPEEPIYIPDVKLTDRFMNLDTSVDRVNIPVCEQNYVGPLHSRRIPNKNKHTHEHSIDRTVLDKLFFVDNNHIDIFQDMDNCGEKLIAGRHYSEVGGKVNCMVTHFEDDIEEPTQSIDTCKNGNHAEKYLQGVETSSGMKHMDSVLAESMERKDQNLNLVQTTLDKFFTVVKNVPSTEFADAQSEKKTQSDDTWLEKKTQYADTLTEEKTKSADTQLEKRTQFADSHIEKNRTEADTSSLISETKKEKVGENCLHQTAQSREKSVSAESTERDFASKNAFEGNEHESDIDGSCKLQVEADRSVKESSIFFQEENGIFQNDEHSYGLESMEFDDVDGSEAIALNTVEGGKIVEPDSSVTILEQGDVTIRKETRAETESGVEETANTEISKKQQKLKREKTMNELDQKYKKADMSVGEVVWGRFGKAWWPAIVVSGEIVERATKKGYTWLYWLSDRKISQVKLSDVDPLQNKFNSRCKEKRKHSMQYGIEKALEICAYRANVDVNEFGSLEGWAKSDKGFLHVKAKRFRPDQEYPVPNYVLRDLKGMGDSLQLSDASSKQNRSTKHVGSTSQDVASTSSDPGSSGLISHVVHEENVVDQARNELDVDQTDLACVNEKTCIACGTEITNGYNHPLFKGKICEKCKETLRESFYAEDDDGCSMFCGVCGEGGDLYVCSNNDCGKAYCFSCVEKHTSVATMKKIEETKYWKCFLCTGYSKQSHGNLIPHQEWSLEVVKFFQTNRVSMCSDLQYLKNSGRRKLRVLSLFDGIGSGKVALDELGLDVDVYYASEINPDALLVANFHHCPVQLGDIWNLSPAKLEELCPLDLVLAGPPCNDLSIVNPDRKGFGGTGILVWRFVAVLKDIQMICKSTNHVFWLMENTASMLTEYRKIISKQFEMEPVVWDAKHFTGQRRARNFWGNIPGMFSIPKFCKQLEKDKKDLNSALISNCNRIARVSHTRTITSSSNSLSITNGVNNPVVSMNGEPDHIWVQELERLFGFPIHYTDVGQLTLERRRKLIGKAWSVPVIKHLLSPLKQYFKVKDT